MRLRKKERERGRVGFCDVVGGDSPAATGIFWAQGGDEREGEKRLMREKGKEYASFDFERERDSVRGSERGLRNGERKGRWRESV
jgi:hypothetical protein